MLAAAGLWQSRILDDYDTKLLPLLHKLQRNTRACCPPRPTSQWPSRQGFLPRRAEHPSKNPPERSGEKELVGISRRKQRHKRVRAAEEASRIIIPVDFDDDTTASWWPSPLGGRWYRMGEF